MTDCIFCKIAKKEILSNIVYEDSSTLAFLDNTPASLGHTLIIPKSHYPILNEMSEKDLKSLILTVQKISRSISELSEGYNLIQNNKEAAGQLVHHVHFHIVPRNKGDKINWNRPNPKFSEEEVRRMIKKTKSNLNL